MLHLKSINKKSLVEIISVLLVMVHAQHTVIGKAACNGTDRHRAMRDRPVEEPAGLFTKKRAEEHVPC